MNKPLSRINDHIVLHFNWKEHGTRAPFAQLWAATVKLQDAASLVISKKGEIDQSRDYTPSGRANAMREYLKAKATPLLRETLATVAAAENEVARIRSAMKPREIDKTDVAGAMRRQEIRAWLRSIDDNKRNAMVSPLGIEEGLDPEIAAAVVEAPAALSGITDQQRARLGDRALVAQYPKEAQEIGLLTDAIRSTTSYVRMAQEVMRKHGAEADDLTLGPTHDQRVAALLAELPSGGA